MSLGGKCPKRHTQKAFSVNDAVNTQMIRSQYARDKWSIRKRYAVNTQAIRRQYASDTQYARDTQSIRE